MLRVAPENFARSIAWRTASAAVSDPSVPTTMRVNTPPPSSSLRAGSILTLLRRETAEPVAEDFGRRRRQAHDRDRHRGDEADDQDHHPGLPDPGHGRTLDGEIDRPAPR